MNATKNILAVIGAWTVIYGVWRLVWKLVFPGD